MLRNEKKKGEKRIMAYNNHSIKLFLDTVIKI